jgi:hypothetical protein
MDNFFLSPKSMEWVEEKDQNLVIFFLNFEKAFNRIVCNLLFKTLQKLDLCFQCVKWVSFFYWLASF